MPLDFSSQEEPTLGRKRTKEELKHKVKIERENIAKGLREKGGNPSLTDEAQLRHQQMLKVLAIEAERAREQFGTIPDHWSYFTQPEAEQMLENVRSDVPARLVNRAPRIEFLYEYITMRYKIIASEKLPDGRRLYGTTKLTYEELTRANDPADAIIYAVNRAIYELGREFRSVQMKTATFSAVIDFNKDEKLYSKLMDLFKVQAEADEQQR